ncbi:hypothetical protein J2W83_001664 [Pseudomonas hunanensis]|uniref:Uncharacterized protein n=1 Tax=Pseudomonas hunanensis TaxID=1247546 RepID=A0ACC6K0T8_9PSED|nr:hypothetical protein [Pseudomonas hunanensis]
MGRRRSEINIPYTLNHPFISSEIEFFNNM